MCGRVMAGDEAERPVHLQGRGKATHTGQVVLGWDSNTLTSVTQDFGWVGFLTHPADSAELVGVKQ